MTNRFKIEMGAVAVLGLFLIVVFPLLNAHGYVSNFTINLWGKYLCFAILAISVDLLWGYTGLLSLGQAVEFIQAQYRHCKPILALGTATALLEAAGVKAALPDGSADPGVICAPAAEEEGSEEMDTVERRLAPTNYTLAARFIPHSAAPITPAS